MIISLSANRVGGKETPLVTWKLLNHPCFKHVNKEALPIEYHVNKKAWMTSGFSKFGLRDLISIWVKKVEKLFLHNSMPHSYIWLRNVKLKFLPANITSSLQSLDQLHKWKDQRKKIALDF